MSFFDQNMKVIKERDIVLYDQVQLQQDRVIENVMSEPAKDGNTYLKRYVNGAWIALNSTYRPLAEAQRFAAAYADQPLYARLLVFGFGNGYIAREIIAQNPRPGQDTADGVYSHVRYAFYEPDFISFLYVLQTYDLTDILNNPDVWIFVEGLNGNLLAGWCNQNVAQLNAKNFQCISLPKYKEAYKESYLRIYGIYEDMMRCVIADTSTKITFSEDILYNNFKHLPYFCHACSLADFMKHYQKTLPYVIVSAGPSLRQNIDELKRMRGYAFIMATDSAAAYLLEQEIVPDGIITIDPRKPLSLFREHMCKIPFFLHTDGNVRIMDMVKPERFYYIGSNMRYYEMLADRRQDRIFHLDTGGSVATAAFSLAVELGITNIVLIGQDLSMQGTQSHVSGQHVQSAVYKWVAGNEEETVGSPFDYYVYLQWFQNKIAANRQLRVINATQGGARIAGAEYLHGDGLYKRICTEANASAVAKIRTYMEQVCPFEDGDDRYRDIHAAIRNENVHLSEHIQEAMQYVEQAMQIISADGITDTVNFQTLTDNIEHINREMIADPEFEWIELCAIGEQDQIMTGLYDGAEDQTENLTIAFNKMHKYYEILLQAYDYFKKKL